MRVISGSAKGHKLKSLEGLKTRPTADRIKESLFNIIAADIPGSNVLDLFAGTGSLGIEALSRGASSAVFVDKNPQAARLIKENLLHTKLIDKAIIYSVDYLEYMDKIFNGEKKYDIIFMDPPYKKGFIISTVECINNKEMLTKDGMIIIEREYDDFIPEEINGLRIIRNQKYGRTMMTFLRY